MHSYSIENTKETKNLKNYKTIQCSPAEIVNTLFYLYALFLIVFDVIFEKCNVN